MKKYFLFLTALFPITLFADGFDLFKTGATVGSLAGDVTGLIYILIPILYVLCFITFFWGLTKFIIGAGNKDELSKGKQYMIWGIVVLFVLITFQTIVGIVSNGLELGGNTTIPTLPTK